MLVAVMVFILDITLRHISAYSVDWIAVATMALDPVRLGDESLFVAPVWSWQFLLVPAAIALMSVRRSRMDIDCSKLQIGVSESQALRPIRLDLFELRTMTGSGI
jgi:hypothetical protein